MVRISFPAMGYSKIAFKSLLGHLPGVEVVEPPEVTRDIVKIGAKYSPEFVCFPFKVTLGEFINMIENHNCNTFGLSIDKGPCRLGFYAPIQERIIKDLGYECTIIPLQQDDLLTFEWLQSMYKITKVKGKIMRNLDIIKGVRLFFVKAKYIEDINRFEGLIRCREVKKGDVTKTVKKLMAMLDAEDDFFKLHDFDIVVKEHFRKIPIKRDFKPLRIVISGEIHVFLETYVNMDLVQKLGDEGIEVHPGHSLYDWMVHKLHVNFRRKNLERLAKKYIPLDIGGEAIWVIGEYIKAQKEGFDGFVHVYPFTCMPEVSARGIIEGQSPDPFYLPIQFYSFDEHTGFEGMRTRIEAFIDLMGANRETNPRFIDKYVEPPEIAEIYDKPIRKSGLMGLFDFITDPLKKMFAGVLPPGV
jgi:predicted nucleotide-binding protein (sugar kinase/HSP70/actin superfamily)